MISRPRIRIGLVDDDEMVRFSTCALLAVHDFDAEQFDSAESLLESEPLDRLNCLIIDYRMSGMTGLELLRKLRETTSALPVIVLSGFLTAADVTDLTNAGAAAILDKPVKTDELLAVLTRLTSDRQVA